MIATSKKASGLRWGVDGRACKLQPYSWKISIAACLLGLPPRRGLGCIRVETIGGLPVPLAACPQDLPEESIIEEEIEPEKAHNGKLAIASVRGSSL